MDFRESLQVYFPGALPSHDYVAGTYQALQRLGFSRRNSIACAGVCRDEITRPVVDEIQGAWGEAFNFSSLAGLIFLGKTGFLAAQAHSPLEGGREHYVFYGLAHIGLGEQGELGLCYRTGRDDPSIACGALAAFQAELSGGRLDLSVDPLDVEMSFVKQRLFRLISYGQVPDLLGLTRLAYQAIVEDMGHMLELTANPHTASYAVLTGIQIHGPDAQTFIWPGEQYTVIEGRKERLVSAA